ncbi:hypothetical protein LX32DRAFT_229026 [Colletotrichum zoysiae]|uniref:Helicase C-terminal domain-containing protein n=1 Tax=Colletotrichum zoysiae TaxID=1216348 RepID=A0AAD9H3T1_9PEZI|nr:hypothetical protein LX32DRAFT_229026 [Colletotrichum zoysiae]
MPVPFSKQSNELVERAVNKAKGPASGGVKEINRVLTKDISLGLQWYYFGTRIDPSLACPSDPLSLIRYVVSKSPKIAWCLQYAIEMRASNERVLFYTVNPLTAMTLRAILTMAGINTISIRSSNTQTERDEAIAAFNDTGSGVTALVTSQLLAAFGVNYHGACHRGVIVENGPNFATQNQSMGRLWRLGQKTKFSGTSSRRRTPWTPGSRLGTCGHMSPSSRRRQRLT